MLHYFAFRETRVINNYLLFSHTFSFYLHCRLCAAIFVITARVIFIFRGSRKMRWSRMSAQCNMPREMFDLRAIA